MTNDSHDVGHELRVCIRAIKDEGLPVNGVEYQPDGSFVVLIGEPVDANAIAQQAAKDAREDALKMEQ